MLRFAKVSIVLLISLLIFTSCERATQMTSSVHTEHPTDETPEAPITIILLIDYPDGDKDAYLQWVASIAPTLQAPEEILRIRAYDNVSADMSPHRMEVFEFRSFLDAETYMSRPEIVAIFQDLPTTKVSSHTFIQQSSYEKDDPHHGEHHHYPVKSIVLINYHPDGRDAYLEWAASVGEILITPHELKSLSTHENYYGESPHRLVVGEFASQADLNAYNALPEIQAVEAALDIQAYDWMEITFELRADYVNQP